MTKPIPSSGLHLGFCDARAARYACEHWHYSKILPYGRLVKVGVWEDGEFLGAVIFGRGASPHLGKKLGLKQTELCELVRVALREHQAPVTRIVSIALRLLRSSNPGMRAVVSFADPKEGHVGGIYQGGNWIHTGSSGTVDEYFVGGRWRHKKSVWYDLRGRYNGKNLPYVEGAPEIPCRVAPGKYRYLYALDPALRATIEAQRLPYPKKRASDETEPPGPPEGRRGRTDPPAPTAQDEARRP
jgi:hypothetical protein